ncbi:MAG: hypothetical protein KDF67_09115 [Ottowia sp.]|nr:hypothetical protein [Rhodoferax sp.]MCB2035745.1 hypothetical protein [Ottowia sp.]MCB2069768.1 hypothetical protein [Ottowia sp.]
MTQPTTPNAARPRRPAAWAAASALACSLALLAGCGTASAIKATGSAMSDSVRMGGQAVGSGIGAVTGASQASDPITGDAKRDGKRFTAPSE